MKNRNKSVLKKIKSDKDHFFYSRIFYQIDPGDLFYKQFRWMQS